MGRARVSNKHLPRRVYFEKGTHRYHPKDGKPIDLGPELGAAMIAYGKLVKVGGELATMGDAMDRYMREVAPKKAPRTYLDNISEMANLRDTFGDVMPQDIKAPAIYKYMDKRRSVVRANREKALLSHVFTYCIAWGLVEFNPCAGMRRDVINHGERPRDRLVTDKELDHFCKHASPLVRAYVAVKELTALRKGDILTIADPQMDEEGIHVEPRKGRRRDPKTGQRTGKKRVIRWTPDLRAAVDAAKALRRPRPGSRSKYKNVSSLWLFATRTGACYYNTETSSADGFDAIWKRYMKVAKAAALEEGWTLEHFTEHDIRAKSGTAADAAGQEGHRLLGNSVATFNKAYKRGEESVQPLQKLGISGSGTIVK